MGAGHGSRPRELSLHIRPQRHTRQTGDDHFSCADPTLLHLRQQGHEISERKPPLASRSAAARKCVSPSRKAIDREEFSPPKKFLGDM